MEKFETAMSQSHLRPLMSLMHACSVKCYDNKSYSNQQLDSCSRSCSANIEIAQKILQQEMNQFNNRLQRGIQDCQDNVQDKVTPSVQNDPEKMSALQGDLLKCVSLRVDEHIAKLPGLHKKIGEEINAATKK